MNSFSQNSNTTTTEDNTLVHRYENHKGNMSLLYKTKLIIKLVWCLIWLILEWLSPWLAFFSTFLLALSWWFGLTSKVTFVPAWPGFRVSTRGPYKFDMQSVVDDIGRWFRFWVEWTVGLFRCMSANVTTSS